VQTAPDGTKSRGSNVVEVISHTVVYKNGLPQPVLQVPPPLECGAAIGVEPAIPSATIRIFSEEPDNGGFKPPVEIGNLRDFPYAVVDKFKLKHRISARAEICADKSQEIGPGAVIRVDERTPLVFDNSRGETPLEFRATLIRRRSP
jgi:hypothetical protein